MSAEEKKKQDEQKARRERFRARAAYDRRFNDAAIAKLRQMGVDLIPVEIPKFPYGSMTPLLEAEAAAAFDELTRTGRDKLLTGQRPEDWPNAFRTARFIPAVEYIQANRARMLAMEAVSKAFEGFDVIVAPTNSSQLVVTNLTGHPALILPNGFRGDDAPAAVKNDNGEIDGDYGGPGTPVSLTFLGQLYGEAEDAGLRTRVPAGNRVPHAASGTQIVKLLETTNPPRGSARQSGSVRHWQHAGAFSLPRVFLAEFFLMFLHLRFDFCERRFQALAYVRADAGGMQRSRRQGEIQRVAILIFMRRFFQGTMKQNQIRGVFLQQAVQFLDRMFRFIFNEIARYHFDVAVCNFHSGTLVRRV